ncbi:sushi, von Willebrand factor type A, EGF and pentraxin domain-containing protein 1 [Strongylocentrotus purpuratus]|uniref:Sushi domain-containing protein n=1 Tax=Strongylocentrotus purpuratus TaxID=7668 RepID=A0A7M7GKZ4_STRPU|nr:sushi, von Willebrand factor type A, EGF and pentraxin domain-containing protein 1 [Strongylocentrotus purpuratus]
MERKLLYFFVLISVAFGSPVPECGPPSELANVITTPSQSVYLLWSRVTFSCEEGYSHSGTEYSYCIESGVWDPRPDGLACLAQCKEPEAGRNIVHFPFGRDPEATKTVYNDEDVIQYACAEGKGATLVGPTQATCKNGFWEPAKMPTCNHCSAPPVSDPKTVQLSPNQQSYAAYAEVMLSCPDDVMYTARGTNITYCEENAGWIPDPTKMTCHENCVLPVRDPLVESRPLQETSDAVKKIFRFNDVISNTCLGGKVLVGPIVQKCANGKWLPDREVMCK